MTPFPRLLASALAVGPAASPAQAADAPCPAGPAGDFDAEAQCRVHALRERHDLAGLRVSAALTAWGTGGAAAQAAVVDAWLDSADHRHVLLDPRMREIGVGVAEGAPRFRAEVSATHALELRRRYRR